MSYSSDDIQLNVNEGELGQTAIDIIGIADQVSDTLSSITLKMNELKNYFDSSEYTKLMNNYNQFKKNYSIVKRNITSYSDDLICLLNKVKQGDRHIAMLISDIAQDTKMKAQNIESL